MGRPALNLTAKLDRFSIPEPNSGCHLWLGGIDRRGYGKVRCNGRMAMAHRAAWSTKHGPIPSGKVICHRCDVPACINPDHLFVGSHDDNMDDMVAKGRSKRGRALPFTRLTEAKVLAIRRDTRKSADVALDYGVSRGAIEMIRRRRSWAYLPEDAPCP